LQSNDQGTKPIIFTLLFLIFQTFKEILLDTSN